jgi:hypothetical protein
MQKKRFFTQVNDEDFILPPDLQEKTLYRQNAKVSGLQTSIDDYKHALHLNREALKITLSPFPPQIKSAI